MDIKEKIYDSVAQTLRQELPENSNEALLNRISEKITSSLAKSMGADEMVLLGMTEEKTSEKEMAVLSVIGQDSVGIVADVSLALKENEANIEGMSQSIVSGYFALILTIDIANMKISIDELQAIMDSIAEHKNLKIYIQHENIFKSMNRV